MGGNQYSAEAVRQELIQWLERYKSSVGEDAQICLDVLEELVAGPVRTIQDRTKLLDLLGILSDLSPDP